MAASIASAATNVARIANDTDTILQAIDAADSVWSNIRQTAVICLIIGVIVLLIVIYLYTSDKQKQNEKEGFTQIKGATTVALYADFRGDNPQMLQQYLPGEHLDRIFKMQLRSGYISAGKHRVTAWAINSPPNVNGNLYAYLKPLSEIEKYNPGLFTRLFVIQPGRTENISVHRKVDAIRLLVEPVSE